MPDDAKRILILGHGAMGQAFEALLSPRHDVAVWDRDLATGEETAPLETVAPGREVVLFACPAKPHEELAGRLAACLGTGAICATIAKGLDERGRTPAQVFDQAFGTRIAWALIYGPMLAREIRDGRAAFATAASASLASGARIKALFEGTRLHLAPLDDVHGATWAAILKNVYVPLVGAADGLGLGDNLRGFLLAEATHELARIVEHMGGRRETAYSLAGLADLVTSATGASSHHRHIGAELALGRSAGLAASGANIRSEGVHTAAMVERHAVIPLERFALFALVTRFLHEPAQFEVQLGEYIAQRFR
jgi:glycerol-3-phosphate dehydrogenase (NAD(P)+)